MFKVNNNDTRTSLFLTLNIFRTFSRVIYFAFELPFIS